MFVVSTVRSFQGVNLSDTDVVFTEDKQFSQFVKDAIEAGLRLTTANIKKGRLTCKRVALLRNNLKIAEVKYEYSEAILDAVSVLDDSNTYELHRKL